MSETKLEDLKSKITTLINNGEDIKEFMEHEQIHQIMSDLIIAATKTGNLDMVSILVKSKKAIPGHYIPKCVDRALEHWKKTGDKDMLLYFLTQALNAHGLVQEEVRVLLRYTKFWVPFASQSAVYGHIGFGSYGNLPWIAQGSNFHLVNNSPYSKPKKTDI